MLKNQGEGEEAPGLHLNVGKTGEGVDAQAFMLLDNLITQQRREQNVAPESGNELLQMLIGQQQMSAKPEKPLPQTSEPPQPMASPAGPPSDECARAAIPESRRLPDSHTYASPPAPEARVATTTYKP